MEKFKKIINALIFPHIAVIIVLVPISVCLLLQSLLIWGEFSVLSYISYVVSAYTLTVICFRIPKMIEFFKRIKEENRVVNSIATDHRLRIRISLHIAFYFNLLYSVFQFVLAVLNGSMLFYSLAAYYFLLALMRMYLLGYARSNEPGADMTREYKRYYFCGVVMLILNLALSVIVTYTVIDRGSTDYGMIVTIAMAAFTFAALSVGIVNVVRYRKFKSPVFNAAKNISLAVAVVSILSLEDAMFATFAAESEMSADGMLIMSATTGFGVMVFVLSLAVMMIVYSRKYLKNIAEEREFPDNISDRNKT